MEAYIKWLNSLVNRNKTEIEGWQQLKWLNGYNTQELESQRNKLIENINGNWLFKATKPYHRQISKGCKLCGLGQWSCLFITGKCNASCFYCPSPQLSDEVPTTQNLTFANAHEYAEYVHHFNFKGVSFSGGEPLLFFDRTLDYLKQVRRKCDPAIYSWMYTNGLLADEKKFRKLAAAGLDEVRFDIGATAYKLDFVRQAKGIIPNVTIEIPAVPEQKESIKALLPQMIAAGVTNLNLHQLRLTPHNFRYLSKKPYTFIFAEHPIVLESELAALEIIDYAREKNLEIGINYCSFFFKNRFQKAGYRNRLLYALAGSAEVITQNGFIREFSGHSIAYKSIRIFDQKPDRFGVESLQVGHKTYYFIREQVMKPTELSDGYPEKVKQLLENEPVQIPADPLLFRIWQYEYIESGLREY